MLRPHPHSVCEDDSLPAQTLRALQRHSFDYFVHEINRDNGLVLDKTAPDWPASIAAMGMALTAYAVGVERQFMARADAAARAVTMLRFLAASEQSERPDATGYKGFYYHFLDMKSGERAGDSEISTVDTALLIAGALFVQSYFDRPHPEEAEIRRLVDEIYRRVDWRWAQPNAPAISHG